MPVSMLDLWIVWAEAALYGLALLVARAIPASPRSA